MGTEGVEITSLCYVNQRLDKNGNHFLYRIADVEEGKLIPPQKSDPRSKNFENRDLVFWSDGPSEINAVGVWNWQATSLWNNPDSDYVKSKYIPYYHPYYVYFISEAKTTEYIIDKLKAGVEKPPFCCDIFFCYEPYWGQYRGVMCSWEDDLEINDTMVRLKEEVQSLPRHSCKGNDIYGTKESEIRFLKDLLIEEPTEHVTVADIDSVIRKAILDRITWPFFKDALLGGRAEWKKTKAALELVCNSSLYESVALALNCTPAKAEEAVKEFTKHAQTLIDAGDIDSEILSKIIANNDELKNRCVSIVEEQWKKDHQKVLKDAKNELDAIQKQVKSSKETEERIKQEIEKKDLELQRLKEEVGKLEGVGDRATQAYREKIKAIQEDWGRFIAENVAYIPQEQTIQTGGTSTWRYTAGSVYQGETPDDCKDWDDTRSLIQGNLEHAFSMDGELAKMLASVLFAAFSQRTPLLIAGPYGRELADALSISVSGKSAGLLELGSGMDSDITAGLAENDDAVIVVQNMFQTGWSDSLLQMLSSLDKLVIWVRPYSEDLQVEPKGLYNYVIPVFSECFIDTMPSRDFVPGAMASGYQAYSNANGSSQRTGRMNLLRNLKLSRYTTNKIQKLIGEAIDMGKLNKTDTEYLFGALPMCVLLDQEELLRESLEKEKSLSGNVRAEIERYLGDA